MLVQLLIGVALNVATIAAMAVLIGVYFAVFDAGQAPAQSRIAALRRGAVLVAGAALWIVLSQGFAIWVWAVAFYVLDIFGDFESAFYFSGVSFTTLGFGDVILPKPWRQLAGLCAANGLLIFGMSTALLTEIMRRLWRDGGDPAD